MNRAILIGLVIVLGILGGGCLEAPEETYEVMDVIPISTPPTPPPTPTPTPPPTPTPTPPPTPPPTPTPTVTVTHIYEYPTVTELRGVLLAGHYSKGYELHVSDCSDYSTTLAKHLQVNFNWNTSVAGGQCNEETEICHAWVMVEMKPNEWLAIETTADPLNSLGVIAWIETNPEYYINMVVLEEWYEVHLYMR